MTNPQNLNVAIMGATGVVGQNLIETLHARQFPFNSLRLFASERSAGKQLDTPGGSLTVEHVDDVNYTELDLAFFAIGGGWPRQEAPKATAAGCTVIDNSSTFRYDDDVPLSIPELTPHMIGHSRLIANPNCTTAIAAIPLWVLHQHYGLQRVIISTYQAASGAGNNGMTELEAETRHALNGGSVNHQVFTHPLPFNVIPHIDTFQENGYTREEMKVAWETQKIFGDDSFPISCTAVRIPTMRAHAESIVVETRSPVDPAEARQLLAQTAGIELRDDRQNNIYPMPLTATQKFEVEVGRIRQNLVFGEHGLEFFVCGDQLLKGAALNAVQIGELIITERVTTA